MSVLKLKTCDNQLSELPAEIIYCTKCVVSNQRPRISFDENGVCSACQWSFEKDNTIDWESREKELQELCNKHRSKDGNFDVIVPNSGGKDSAFVAHQLKTRYNMNPLCITWAPFEWTTIGWKNLNNFVKSGFNNIIAQPDGNLHRKLSRVAFDILGDAWQPFTYGQKSWAFHMAKRFGIKLIFYGENGELEYGGSTKYKHIPKECPEDWEKDHFKGAQIDKLVDYGIDNNIITKNDVTKDKISWYKPLDPNIIADNNMEMHWFSYYQKWIPHENFYYAAKHTNFETSDIGRMESTYTKYASLDDKADGFHFYLGYMKFGLGRATRDAMQDIRRHHITREEGVRLVHLYDHEVPTKYLSWFLEYLDITEEYFWDVMNYYRHKSNAWIKVNNEWKLKSIVQ